MKFSKKYAQLFVAAVFFGVSATAGAANILFAHVDDDPPYVPGGDQLASMLSAGGHTVTTRFLDAAVYNDYATFDQIFVYDLYADTDDTSNQLDNYTGIANWYKGLTDKNLILDGRIISSTCAAGGCWVVPTEDAWIQNYATQLDNRGGGLVLGTDHATDFTRGINMINQQIGVGEFTGYFGGPQAIVDPLSPLYLATLVSCTAAPSEKCINDNSSTSFVADGLQANGQFLTPVAYHGTTLDAFGRAAVSSTIGSPTFETCDDGSPPPCDGIVPEPSILFLFATGLFGVGFARRRIPR